MDSTTKPTPESTEAAPLSKSPDGPPPPNLFLADFVLRILLFASTITALVVMVTSKQTKSFMVPFVPVPVSIVRDAKFDQSPALIYFVVAHCVAGIYSIITVLISFACISMPKPPNKLLLLLASLDTLLAGIMASATGAVAAIAYVGLKGNSHAMWPKVCNNYGKFCRHVGSSVSIALFASILLVLLVLLSTYSLYCRTH